jgi:hypothetical protein
VKFLGDFALGYSNVAGQFAGREPDGDCDVALHHALGRVADAQGFGRVRCDTQRFDRDVVELQIIERREVVMGRNGTCTGTLYLTLYAERNLVERFFNAIKHYRGVRDQRL